jgi:ATP-binding cassette subfamily B protein
MARKDKRAEAQAKGQGVPGKGSRGKRASDPKRVAKETLKMVFGFYPLQFTLMMLCVVASAVLSTFPSIILQQTIEIVNNSYQTGDWSATAPQVIQIVITLVSIYAVALACQIAQTQAPIKKIMPPPRSTIFV